MVHVYCCSHMHFPGKLFRSLVDHIFVNIVMVMSILFMIFRLVYFLLSLFIGITKSVLYTFTNFLRFLSLFQSTNDNPMAMAAVGFFVALYYMIARMKWLYHQ